MAIEQWEIDLRKKLEGTQKPKNWEKQLMEDVNYIPETKKEDNVVLLLLIFIVLGLITLFAYEFKTKKISSMFSKENIENKEVISVPENNEIDVLKSEIIKLTLKTDKLKDYLNNHANKVNLLGMISNQNFWVIQANKDKKDLVYFNRDWTINKMPNGITLTEEDKLYLQKYVKAQ